MSLKDVCCLILFGCCVFHFAASRDSHVLFRPVVSLSLDSLVLSLSLSLSVFDRATGLRHCVCFRVPAQLAEASRLAEIGSFEKKLGIGCDPKYIQDNPKTTPR